jgi:hypothetical protein
MAAAIGNQYAAKAKQFQMAIDRALEKKSRVEQRDALEAIAETLIKMAQAGDIAAIKEIGDRLDGKPKQSVDVDANVRTNLVDVLQSISSTRNDNSLA